MKRKIYIVVFISCFIFVAMASDSKFFTAVPATAEAVKHHPVEHEFDSNGLCTCVRYTNAEEMEQAPRIHLNKQVAEFVKKYNKKNGKYLDLAKIKVNRYYTIIDSILEEEGLPGELKHLAFIESGLQKNINTHSGATGPWALMPKAAKQYGLKIGNGKDERIDYYKSTRAAAGLLKDLYKEYGDWLLVIAAYNTGPGGMQKAIKKAGSRNYWTLQQFLPDETRSHVKRFIAVHYQFEGHGSLVTMSKPEMEAHVKSVEEFTARQAQHQQTDSLTVVADK